MTGFNKVGNAYEFNFGSEDLVCNMLLNGEDFKINVSATAMMEAQRLYKKMKSLEVLVKKKQKNEKEQEKLAEESIDILDNILIIALGEEQYDRFRKVPMSSKDFKTVTSFIIAKVNGKSDDDIDKELGENLKKEVKK